MENSYSESYKAAGVDVTAGYKAVELIKGYVEATRTKGVIGGLGGFGGLFRPDFAGMEDPVLVSGTDGVGTKLKIAFCLNKHDTVGVDAVAMCVNDIVCSGAAPLFFLDYIALGKNVPERVAEIVKGVADGCRQAGAALIGGETAEMPGFYPENEYDIAGFSVGLVDRKAMIDGSKIQKGDVLLGLASNGVHSNGFSLVRRVFNISEKNIHFYCEDLGCTLGEELIKPTRIYVRSILELMKQVEVKGISHITGGGFYENVPRMFDSSKTAVISKSSYDVPPIFGLIAHTGGIKERDMYNTFNMGVGMVVCVSEAEADKAVHSLESTGEKVIRLGYIDELPDRVIITD